MQGHSAYHEGLLCKDPVNEILTVSWLRSKSLPILWLIAVATSLAFSCPLRASDSSDSRVGRLAKTRNPVSASRSPHPRDAKLSILNSHSDERGRFDLRNPVFIENQGQFDERVRFRIVGNGASLWLTDQGIVFDFVRRKDSQELLAPEAGGAFNFGRRDKLPGLRKAESSELERIVFSQKLVGAGSKPVIEANEPLPGTYNYFIGSAPAKWHTHVRAFREVVYHDVWQGIDLKLYANGRNLEQEFIVHPGADPSQVRLAYEGIKKLDLATNGSLQIHTDFGNLIESQPRLFQELEGKRVAVKGRFSVSGNSYTFEVGHRNKELALVIDPTLLYSTFLGGSTGFGCGPFSCGTSEQANAIAVDLTGSAYVTGFTQSVDFPTTVGAFQTTLNRGASSAFVTKLNATGDQFVYSTYFGPGFFASATGVGIAVGPSNEAYITGTATISRPGDFPITPNAYQTACASSFFFLTKLNAAGDGLVYSTCFGLAGKASGIALDSSGRAYITGSVGNPGSIPTTAGAFQPGLRGGINAFLSVFSPSLSGTESLAYSTYLGTNNDQGEAVAVDSQGNAYIAGLTESRDFPVTAGAFKTAYPGALVDIFVAKLSPSAIGAASLIYATFLGGSTPGDEDEPSGIAVDATGAAYVTGSEQSSDFPVTVGAFQTISRHSGQGNAFLTKLTPDGRALVYSTLFGGSSGAGESANGIALDANGNAYITGSTSAPDLPTTPGAFQLTLHGGGLGFGDAFVAKFDATGSKLIYSSYFGGRGGESGTGIAVDATGDAYITGFTTSTDFPVLSLAQRQLTPAVATGPLDAFIAKFAFGIQSQLSVSGAVPGSGGNTGNVTVTVLGGGFVPGTTVKLACPSQPEILAANISTAPDGRTLKATFNLTGVTPGQCLLTALKPDGTSVSAANSFTVEQGGAPDVWVEVMGFSQIRGGRPQIYYLNYGNQGNLDAGIVRLWLSFPDFMEWSLLPDVVPSSSGQSNGNTFIALDVNLTAGSTNVVPVTLTLPDLLALGHRVFQVQAWKEGR
jgi:hypothetical protein